jgi:methylmalonic aciduria homocystinuria type C protein
MEVDVRLAWAALRDCVQLGAEHRYSEAQLVYHYTKDKAVLLQAMRS